MRSARRSRRRRWTSSTRAGRAALDGAPGPTRDALVLGAALALWHAGLVADVGAGAARAREALDSGAAAERLAAAGETSQQ